MDGLVYGVAASLGFAAYENIEYVLYSYEQPSYSIALIRAFPQCLCMQYVEL